MRKKPKKKTVGYSSALWGSDGFSLSSSRNSAPLRKNNNKKNGKRWMIRFDSEG
jgi:hypothetical protein